jgi:hypothetical protein
MNLPWSPMMTRIISRWLNLDSEHWKQLKLELADTTSIRQD